MQDGALLLEVGGGVVGSGRLGEGDDLSVWVDASVPASLRTSDAGLGGDVVRVMGRSVFGELGGGAGVGRVLAGRMGSGVLVLGMGGGCVGLGDVGGILVCIAVISLVLLVLAVPRIAAFLVLGALPALLGLLLNVLLVDNLAAGDGRVACGGMAGAGCCSGSG